MAIHLFFNRRHQIAKARTRHDMPGGVRVKFKLLPQTRNTDPQDFLVRFIFRAPNTGQKFLRCEDLADVVGKL